MRFRGDIAEAIRGQLSNPIDVYRIGQMLSAALIAYGVIQEYYYASQMAAHYVRGWCGGAGVIDIESSLLHGTTCIYSAGDSYWLAAGWEYFFRTQNTFISEAGLSLNHWLILIGAGAWFVFAYWLTDLKHEYILDELDQQKTRFYFYHDRETFDAYNLGQEEE